jgi:hypothetical protein
MDRKVGVDVGVGWTRQSAAWTSGRGENRCEDTELDSWWEKGCREENGIHGNRQGIQYVEQTRRINF